MTRDEMLKAVCEERNELDAEAQRLRLELIQARQEFAALTAERDALRAGLDELDAHARYALDLTGQRTAPARFVPSAAKLIREIVRRAKGVTT